MIGMHLVREAIMVLAIATIGFRGWVVGARWGNF